MKIKRNIKDTHRQWSDGRSGDDSIFPQQISQFLKEDMVFHFPDGIPAFEDSKRFVILLNPKIKPFVYLKSLDVEDLGFVCVDPFLVCQDYSINIPAKDLSCLELKDPSMALALSLVTVESDPRETTTNLLAPVLINIENSQGRQVVLTDEYPVRYKIWEGLEKFEKET